MYTFEENMLNGLILFQPSFKREFQSFMFAKTSEDILQVWNTVNSDVGVKTKKPMRIKAIHVPSYQIPWFIQSIYRYS